MPAEGGGRFANQCTAAPHFTEFRNKTEFSDMPIGGNSIKLEVLRLANTRPSMAPPLLK